MLLTDAELVLGLSRHLSAYAMGPDRAGLGNLEFAGQVLDMAFRLRGSTTSPANRVRAIGLDVGLSPLNLREVVITMESMDWLTVTRSPDQKMTAIAERIPPPVEVISSATRLMDLLAVESAERSALALLRASTMQPLLVQDALQLAAEAADGATEAAETALRHLTATGLVRRVRTDDGREVVYNPNVWIQGDAIAQAALRAADAHATKEVAALMEEVAANPALPELHVKSTEQRWVQFAISQGLIQRSVVQTSDGKERGFLFTPHLARNPFGGTAGDASGQVRQLIGSMVYAATFATYRLHSPDVFLQSLISRGVAGNVSSIGTDYPMLEKAGIVRVIPGSPEGRFRLELLQAEIAEEALKLLSTRDGGSGPQRVSSALQGQQAYVQIEQDRARLARTANTDDVEQARLISALREASVRRTIGGR